MGMNLPETAFSTSWATRPPMAAATGEMFPEHTLEKVAASFSSSSGPSAPNVLLADSAAILTNSSASEADHGAGWRPCFLMKSFKATKQVWIWAGLSILPKSVIWQSSAFRESFRDLKLNFLGSLTWVTTPPLSYWPLSRGISPMLKV